MLPTPNLPLGGIRDETPTEPAQRVPCPSDPRSRIAGLTAQQIAKMSLREMAQAIRSSELPIMAGDRLEFLESDTLVRLVYMARHHCRRHA